MDLSSGFHLRQPSEEQGQDSHLWSCICHGHSVVSTHKWSEGLIVHDGRGEGVYQREHVDYTGRMSSGYGFAYVSAPAREGQHSACCGSDGYFCFGHGLCWQ